MTWSERFSLLRLHSARRANEPDPNRAQRLMGLVVWLLAVGLAVAFRREIGPVNWPLLALFTATHVLSGLLAIRLPGGSYVGFLLTNLVIVALVQGFEQAIIISLAGSAVVVPLVLLLAPLLGLRNRLRPVLVFEVMYTSATNALVVALAMALYNADGGDLGHSQTSLMVILIAAAFALSTLALVAWQAAGRADLRGYVRLYWPIVTMSHAVSMIALPVVAADYYGTGNYPIGFVACLLGVALLYLFNSMYLDLMRRVANLALINSIGRALSARLELDDLLPVMRHEIGKLMDVTGFYLALVDEDKQQITFPVDFEDNQPVHYDPTPLDGTSLTAYVIRTRQPLLLKDKAPGQLRQIGIEPIGPQSRSYVGVPIISSDQALGMIGLRSFQRPGAYDEDDVALLGQVAAQAAIALQNARLFSQSQRQASELSSLQEVSTMMTASTDLHSLIRAICEIVVNVMGYQKVAVFFLGEDGRTVHLADSIGMSERFIAESRSLSIADRRAEVFRTGQPVIVDDLTTNHYYGQPPGPARQEGAQVVLEVPLTLGGQTIGSLAAYYDRPHSVTPGEISLLQTLSGQIAVAVANARLFEATVERSHELETLYEASAAVNASLSLRNVLRALSVSMIQALRVPSCTTWLASDDRMALRASLRMTALEGGANEEPIIAVTLDLDDLTTIQRAISRSEPAVLRFNAPDLTVGEQRLLYQCRITSGIALPLVMHSLLLGLIVIPLPDENRDITLDERRLAMGLANHAAVAIDNARRFERTDVALGRRLDEISALERISQRIASHLDLKEVIDEVAQAALANTGSEFIDVALLNAKTRMVNSLIRRSAIPDQDTAESWPADEGLTGRAIRTRQTIVVGDVSADPEYSKARERVRAELVAPIMLEDRVLGVINLESIRLNAFTDDHLRFAVNLAEHAAIAISNANLYESERRQRQIAELLLETSSIVASSPNLNQVLLTLSEQLLRISGFQGCTIMEIDETSGLAYSLAEHIHCIWPPDKGRVYRVSDFPLTAQVLKTGQPAIVRKGMKQPDEAELAFMAEASSEALVMLAITAGSKIIGLVELQSTSPDLAADPYLIDNANHLLEQASRWLVAPLRANPSARLIELASELYRVSGHHLCTLSDWDKQAGQLHTTVDFGDLVWQPRQGPGYPIAEYPELVEVLESGESRVFKVDEKSDLGRVKTRARRGAHTLVIQPLARKGHPIGIVELVSVSGGQDVGEEDLRIWRLVADQASVAIENARLFEAIQRRGEEFSTLRTVALETLAQADLISSLNIICRHALERSGAMDVQIYLVDHAHDQLTFGASVSRSAETPRVMAAPRPDGLTATVARTGEMMAATDLAHHPLFQDVINHPTWLPVRAIMGVPLKSGSDVLGVFNISFDDERLPDEDTMHFLDLLAAQAAIAIENNRLAEATRTGRDRLQAILDSAHDGIIMLDPKGQLLLANPRAEYLLNTRLSDQIGKPIFDIVRPMKSLVSDREADFLTREVVRFGRMIEEDPALTTRQQYMLDNPTRAVEAVSTGVHGRDQELLGRLLILHDVTYQYELEAYRQEMSGMIVHDLRSPLASLITGLDMALGELGHLPPQANADALKVMLGVGMSSAQALLKLVEGILDVNKLEAGEVPLLLADVSLKDIARRVCKRLEAVAIDAAIELRLELPDRLPHIVADAEKIERVVVNLLDNALRYTPRGGHVTVAVEAARAHQMLSVTDSGEGIPAEYRERIFEKFYQINPKGRRRGTRGTGLGLTFSRLAVEAHRGRIWVDSGPEGGAAFHFTLPTNLEPTPLPAEPSAKQRAGG